MARIFVVLVVLVVVAVVTSMLILSACDKAVVPEVKMPDDVVAVTTPFFAAVRRGDQAAAEKFVAPTFVDDSRVQFDEMSVILKKSPKLVAAMYAPKPGMLGPDESEVNLLFAAKDGDQWTSSEIRMYRAEGETFEIEYWDVASSNEAPHTLANAAMMQQFMGWFMGGMAVLALLALAALIWFVKRRTHIFAPNTVTDIRRVATTVRDLE